MYYSIFFLLLLFIIVGESSFFHAALFESPQSTFLSFFKGFSLYLFLLSFLILQNRLLRYTRYFNSLNLIANFEIIFFFIVFCLFWGSDKIFSIFPLLNDFPSIRATFDILLYFFALYIFHLTKHSKWNYSYAIKQIYFLLPFVLPFIVCSLVMDLLNLSEFSSIVNFIIFLGLLLIAILFFPFFIIRIWQCIPLPRSPLTNRLMVFCNRVNFNHSGLLNWTILNSSYTAGVMGVLPICRYVIFTRNLIQTFTDEEIEAILAHEIGHSQHYHLIFYPLIFLGMPLFMLLYQNTLLPPLGELVSSQKILNDGWEENLIPILFSIPYLLIAGLFFRIIFGYFSRLFERQADLSVIEYGLPTRSMISALDRIGNVCGNIHHESNWHHYGIAERMECLAKAEENPRLVNSHAKKVKWSVGLYLIFLAVIAAYELATILM